MCVPDDEREGERGREDDGEKARVAIERGRAREEKMKETGCKKGGEIIRGREWG